MKQLRDTKGRYAKRYRQSSRWEKILVLSLIAGYAFAIMIDAIYVNAQELLAEPEANVEEVITEPREVRLEVIVNWTPERIEQEIRQVFHEQPDIAVRIAKCESGMVSDIQSHHTWRGERERSFGIMQIHQDSWHDTALQLGYDKYQYDVKHNLAMARHIYENAGKQFSDWSCYTKKLI